MTATEVKARILSLLDEVAAGEDVEITKHGRTVARLVPAHGPHSLHGRGIELRYRGTPLCDRAHLGPSVKTVLLDSHVVHWWSAEPEKLSKRATRAIEAADELAVNSITWFELAWLAHHERITLSVPVRSWVEGLAEDLRTVATTPAIADTAASLPAAFPGDPADRLIYATAVENGWQLLTKDRRLRGHRHPRPITVW
jgi:prevent-host-death family protein